MKVIVSGGRKFDDYELLSNVLNEVNRTKGITAIVQGGQKTWLHEERRHIGADFFAKKWAIENKIPYEEYSADWIRFGIEAGFIRNQEMLDESGAKKVIAFPGGNGTYDMIRRARNTQGIELTIVEENVCNGQMKPETQF